MKHHRAKLDSGRRTLKLPTASHGVRWLQGLIGLLLITLVGAGLFATLSPRKKTPLPSPVEAFPLPVVSSSPYLNTKPEAQYVGSEACQSCHVGHSASFRRTPMGRSMALVDEKREPPDGVFDHPLSKR